MGLYESLWGGAPANNASDRSIYQGLGDYFGAPARQSPSPLSGIEVDLPAMLHQQMQVGTSVRINPENWNRMLQETPPSQNIEDRRNEIVDDLRRPAGRRAGPNEHVTYENLMWKLNKGMELQPQENLWLELQGINPRAKF